MKCKHKVVTNKITNLHYVFIEKKFVYYWQVEETLFKKILRYLTVLIVKTLFTF